jgi:hypothetical protein
MLYDQFLNKKWLALFFVWASSCAYSFYKGTKSIQIPHEVECKKELKYLDQCNSDLIHVQQEHVQNLIDCTTQCKIDTCKPLCVTQVTEAIDSYKRLEKEFKCGGGK